MEEFSIIWSPKARKDIDDIYFYLAYYINEINIANKTIQKIFNSISTLDHLPERFLQISNYIDKTKNIRRMPVNNYIVIYEVEKVKKKVFILHIFHGRQDYLDKNKW